MNASTPPGPTRTRRSPSAGTRDQAAPADPEAAGADRAMVWGAAIILLVGTVLIGLVLSGRVGWYLQPSFTPYLAATGIGLLALAAWTLLLAIHHPRAMHQAHEHGEGRGHGHDHSKLPGSAWLLLVPVVLLAVCMPAPLGSYVLNNRTAAAGNLESRTKAAQQRAEFAELPGGEAVTDIRIDKYWDRYIWGDPTKLRGRRVAIIGFVTHPAPTDGGRTFAINRFRVFCCAADATSYTIHVDAGQDVADDTWVKVTGVLSEDSTEGHPVLKASRVDRIDEPKVPYLS